MVELFYVKQFNFRIVNKGIKMAGKRLQRVERKQVTARLPERKQPSSSRLPEKQSVAKEPRITPRLPERKSPNVVKARLPERAVQPVRTSEEAKSPRLPARTPPQKTYRLPEPSFQKTFTSSAQDKIADQVREMSARIGGKNDITPPIPGVQPPQLPALRTSEQRTIRPFRHG